MYWRWGQGDEDGLACKIGTQFAHICNKKNMCKMGLMLKLKVWFFSCCLFATETFFAFFQYLHKVHSSYKNVLLVVYPDSALALSQCLLQAVKHKGQLMPCAISTLCRAGNDAAFRCCAPCVMSAKHCYLPLFPDSCFSIYSKYLTQADKGTFRSPEHFHTLVEREILHYQNCFSHASVRSCAYNVTLSTEAEVCSLTT